MPPMAAPTTPAAPAPAQPPAPLPVPVPVPVPHSHSPTAPVTFSFLPSSPTRTASPASSQPSSPSLSDEPRPASAASASLLRAHNLQLWLDAWRAPSAKAAPRGAVVRREADTWRAPQPFVWVEDGDGSFLEDGEEGGGSGDKGDGDGDGVASAAQALTRIFWQRGD